MITVIFEFIPKEEHKSEYLDIAGGLRAELEKIDGFISVERFQSITDPRKMVSLSFFRDEEAVKAWRNHAEHREGQASGRGGIFEDYRIRVASVIRDYSLNERDEAPEDSRQRHG